MTEPLTEPTGTIVIEPTIGRIVWFHPNGALPYIAQHDVNQPLAAIVAYVWNERLINVRAIDQDGNSHAVTTVRLLQDSDVATDGCQYAEWMPFQKGQAEPANQ